MNIGLDLITDTGNELYVTQGNLECTSCQRTYAIESGIAKFPIFGNLEERDYRDNHVTSSHPMGLDLDYWPNPNDWNIKPVLFSINKALEKVSHPNGLTVDLGSGFGYYWRHINTGRPPILVDFSFDTLYLAKKRFENIGIFPDFVMADITHPPFKKKSISLVVAIQAHQHIEETEIRENAIAKAAGIIHENGALYYNQLNTPQFPRIWSNLSTKNSEDQDFEKHVFLRRTNTEELKSELSKHFLDVQIRGRFWWRQKLALLPGLTQVMSSHEKIGKLFSRDLDAFCTKKQP